MCVDHNEKLIQCFCNNNINKYRKKLIGYLSVMNKYKADSIKKFHPPYAYYSLNAESISWTAPA